MRRCRFLRRFEIQPMQSLHADALWSNEAGMLKELRLAFGRGVKIMLCLGSMLNDTWPTEETKSLSRYVTVPTSQ